MTPKRDIQTIVFDLGAVLIDWNPVYMYKKMFAEPQEMDYFLKNICTKEWNEKQDAGRSLYVATQELVQKHPEYETYIRAFYGRWTEMLGGPIEGTVNILEEIYQSKKYKLLALTNWSGETFPFARCRFHFLNYFEDIFVSGILKTKKPDSAIFSILINRSGIAPNKSLFIDDSGANIEMAAEMGFHTIKFMNPELLRKGLKDLGILEEK